MLETLMYTAIFIVFLQFILTIHDKIILFRVELIFLKLREISVNEIRKERMVISIATVAFLFCSLQNYIGGWEFWVPPVCCGVVIALWWLHIRQKATLYTRVSAYFAFAAFLLFYHGIHDTSMFDVSVSTTLFIATFAVYDRKILINIIMVEYFVIMLIQFIMLWRSGEGGLDAFYTVKILFHIGTVMTMYFFSRLTIGTRVSEKEKLDNWRKAVKDNESDMEDFLANISHELRTPLNVIGGMTALLKKNIERDELGSIEEASARLSHQIEDIQDYTEIKRGDLKLEEDFYMCSSLINDVVSSYQKSEKRNKLELIVDLSPQTPNRLVGDMKMLHKIFRHLLSNAVKFTRRGGIYLKVYSVPENYGINLIIEVTDTGIGMTRAQIARLSDGMYQANRKRNRSTGGIGLGLPIVFGIVHKMGGFVKIDSSRGAGTTVHISIPQKVADPSPCLSIKGSKVGDIIFYIKPEKYNVPELREFNSAMAVNLATGLKVPLYSASDQRELGRLIKELNVTHIFLGQEEYEQESGSFDKLVEDGYRVVVSGDVDFTVTNGSGVLVMPKPLYGFPVVRIINGDFEDYKAQNIQEEKLYFNGIKALVVDDEPMNLVVASGLLKEYGMSVDTAESGKISLEKYSSCAYDVIFMDHMMPEMDGVETMKRIKQIARETGRKAIVIALTANAISGAREMFINEGFDGFIAKPIEIQEFERVMRRVLPTDDISYEGRKEA